jgi:hypothetical protein
MRLHVTSALALAAALTVTLAAGAAHAGPDLSVSVSQPSNVYVYAPVRYTVRVTNVGNQNSVATTLTVQLPLTHTSPTVTVLGTVGEITAGCTRTGTRVTCPIPRLGRNAYRQFYVTLTAPQSDEPITLTASVPVASSEPAANNTRTHTAALLNIDHVIAGENNVVNRHCTGTSLTSFFECELDPSSIASHATVLHADHTISIPQGGASYGGTWSQPNPDELVFQYTENGQPVVDFYGYGVGGGCFEGITTFPNSTGNYVSPYEVCLTPQ